MIFKSADNKDRDIAVLEQIAARAGASEALKAKIAHEIKIVQAGQKGEREAAYEIDFYLRDSKDYAVLHDLRIEHGGRVAQIDHLVIDRDLRFWVLESKHFAEGVAVNDIGEFTAFYRGRPQGIASPVEQNKRHCDVLRDLILQSGQIRLPKFLFMTIQPNFRNVVLVSKKARIQRARGWQEKNAWIIKADQFWTFLQAQPRRSESAMWACKQQQLELVAYELAACHEPIQFDWEARFAADGASQEKQDTPVEAPTKGRSKSGVDLCGRCEQALTSKEVWFCRYNKNRFKGGVYCKTCQPKFNQDYSNSPLSLGSPSFRESEKSEAKPQTTGDGTCARCGDLVPARVTKFCSANPEKFRGHIFCRPCQAKV